MKLLKNPLIAFLIVFLLLGGGGLLAYKVIAGNYELRSYEIESYNNLYSISVPSGWNKSSGASANAIIAAESPSCNMYAMVSINDSSFENGSTIEEYLDSYIAGIANSSDDPLVQVLTVPPEPSTMGENTGYYFEIDTMSQGTPIHMWNFMFNGMGGYVHVTVCSLGEENREHAETALNIIKSVKNLQIPVSDANDPAEAEPEA